MCGERVDYSGIARGAGGAVRPGRHVPGGGILRGKIKIKIIKS